MNTAYAQQLRRPRLANGLPALPVIALTALAMALLVISLHAGPAFQQAARFFCIVPVALAAYRKKGLPPGLLLAAFFSAALLLQGMFVSLGQERIGVTLEAITLSIGLGLVAYAVAVIADSFWKQSVLAGAVMGSQELLARSADLGEAANYIVRLAASAANAETAALLLKHPVDRTWRVYGRSAAQLEPPAAGESLSLAWWLVETNAAQRLNRMEDDPRFIMVADAPVGSLLAYPLRERDGELAAMLVLINKRKGVFTGEDAAALELRAAGVGQALEQATASSKRPISTSEMWRTWFASLTASCRRWAGG